MALSQRDGEIAVSTLDDESDSDTSSILSQIFSDNGSDDESASDLESDNQESDDESDSDDDDLHDKGLSKDIIVKVEDVIALVATEKNLKETRRAKKNMYIEDVSEFTRVLLSTTETSFGCGWRRTQLLFYTQLAVITDLGLRLIRDPEGGRPNLFIFLKPDFTKRFLGKKAPLHVCLLSMLFHIEGFKRITETGPVLDNAKKLYSVGIVDGLNQQDLKLKDEILNKYVFCQVERETTGYRIVLEKRMLSSTLRSQMRRVGEITTFEDIVKPYLLWYAAAKEFNNSALGHSDVHQTL
uniref:ATP-dependent RNA helicase DBP10 n=1 Tax=Talaromyces marneffei PM1 TaxID=1077442 RepID=A0A093UM05_TALMA